MELYILACIIVMTFAAIVVTQEPKENSEFPKAARKKKGGGYVSRRPGESLSATAGFSQR
jgi:hypothetical protein